VQPDVEHKLQTIPNFLQHLSGDLQLLLIKLLVERPPANPPIRFGDGHTADIQHRLAAHSTRRALRGATAAPPHEGHGCSLIKLAYQRTGEFDAFDGTGDGCGERCLERAIGLADRKNRPSPPPVILKVNLLIAGAEDKCVTESLRQLLPGCLQIFVVMFGDGLQLVHLPFTVFLRTLPYQRIAPSIIERVGSVHQTGSTYCFVPNPLHSGHIPNGELKMNSCGVSSGKLMPQWAQAWCSLNTISSEGSPSPWIISTVSNPSLARSAVSTESISRV
jgi:hypothetical protein